MLYNSISTLESSIFNLQIIIFFERKKTHIVSCLKKNPPQNHTIRTPRPSQPTTSLYRSNHRNLPTSKPSNLKQTNINSERYTSTTQINIYKFWNNAHHFLFYKNAIKRKMIQYVRRYIQFKRC